MAERTFLDEATEAVLNGGHTGSRDDARDVAAVVLAVAAARFRREAQRYRDAKPAQATLGAMWSATRQAMEWDHIAEMITPHDTPTRKDT